ncbi:MAG: transcriptional regulator [Halobacteriaceae archaeon]
MREAEETTRERMRKALRAEAMTPRELAEQFDVTPSVALDHVGHVARSLSDADEKLLVRPPRCRDCGFDDFDDPLNRPSRCPECKSERVADPAFRID